MFRAWPDVYYCIDKNYKIIEHKLLNGFLNATILNKVTNKTIKHKRREGSLWKLCNSTSGAMPAQAGIQSVLDLPRLLKPWIPACAGMTGFCRASLRKSLGFYFAPLCVLCGEKRIFFIRASVVIGFRK